jgi:hypothetical protein
MSCIQVSRPKLASDRFQTVRGPAVSTPCGHFSSLFLPCAVLRSFSLGAFLIFFFWRANHFWAIGVGGCKIGWGNFEIKAIFHDVFQIE